MTEKGIDINNPEVLLVSGALLRPELAAEAAQYVEAEDFQDKRLGKIWGAIAGMLEAGVKPENIDPVGVGKRFADDQERQLKVALFCDQLIETMPRVSSLVMSAHRVRRRATMRMALENMREIAVALKSEIESNDGAMPDLDERLAGLSIAVSKRSDKEKRRVTLKDLVKEVTGYFDRLASGTSNYIPTGLPKVDECLGGGLRPGQLHVVLGGTGSGKTAFASQICDNAIAHGRRAMMFSMEVDPLDIFIRDAERNAGVSRWDLRGHASRDEAISKLARSLGDSMASPGKVIYGNPISVEGIRQAILTERLRSGNIELVVVDHAQVALPSKSERASMPRYLQVKGTAEGLQALARALNVAVVLTAQMNPPGKGETPSMFMVRESKDIVNPAEVVIVIYHEKAEINERVEIVKSWIVLEKVRAGREGKIQIRYNGKLFRFEEPALDEF